MSVVLRVTAIAHSRCFTIGRSALVTTLAGRGDVGIAEGEVGEVVVESNLAESRDIGTAAQVLGMASAALTPRGLTHATVITAFGADILSDLFVTTQALRALPLAVGEVVTVRAFGLDVGVRLGDGTGHHELLDAGRPGAWVEQQYDRQGNQRSRVVG